MRAERETEKEPMIEKHDIDQDPGDDNEDVVPGPDHEENEE